MARCEGAHTQHHQHPSAGGDAYSAHSAHAAHTLRVLSSQTGALSSLHSAAGQKIIILRFSILRAEKQQQAE